MKAHKAQATRVPSRRPRRAHGQTQSATRVATLQCAPSSCTWGRRRGEWLSETAQNTFGELIATRCASRSSYPVLAAGLCHARMQRHVHRARPNRIRLQSSPRATHSPTCCCAHSAYSSCAVHPPAAAASPAGACHAAVGHCSMCSTTEQSPHMVVARLTYCRDRLQRRHIRGGLEVLRAL